MDLFFGSDEESLYTVELVYHPIDSIEVIRQDGGIYFKDFASAEAYCKDWLDSGEATVYEYIISKEYPIHLASILSNHLSRGIFWRLNTALLHLNLML